MERARSHTSRRFFDLFLRLLANGTLDDARDRFAWRNFERVYRDLVDTWAVYDTSDYVPFLLEEGSRE